MRILLLSTIILACFYTFLPSVKERAQSDSVKLLVSAPKRTLAQAPVPARPLPKGEGVVEESDPVEPELEPDESEVSPTALQAGEDQVEVETAAENNQQKAWQDELGQTLANLDPENGEEMLNSYVAERKSFDSGLDEIVRGNQKNQDLDTLISELEAKHEERVKEIFGRHYEEIKEHQYKFEESETP